MPASEDKPSTCRTPLQVLLAYGLHPRTVALLTANFPDVEAVAATARRHRDGTCGPYHDLEAAPCAWCSGQGLGLALPDVENAVDAWCSTGWLARGLLAGEPVEWHDHPDG